MYKKIFLYLFIHIFLYAQENTQKESVEILAKKLINTDDIVKATGDVLIFSPSYYITAKEVIYSKKDKTLELFNDVNVLKQNNLLSSSNYAFIDFQNDTGKSDNILLLDKKTNIWIDTNSSIKNNNIYKLDSSKISSCDYTSPVWSIKFSSGDYDTDKKWINAYNAIVYLGPVPIFYLPWIGFTTYHTRSTGLLRPIAGYSQEEGFLYSQSIFYAPKKNWDIELNLQTRLKRGNGAFLKYRYIDSKYSSFNLDVGYFREKDLYLKENDIKNIYHSGFDIEYKRTKLFSSKNSQDGLLLSFHDLNDIGYKNLKNIKDNNDHTNLQGTNLTSKLDYYYDANKYFISNKFRYYKDVTQDKNDNLLQQSPNINFRKYFNNIASTNLSYQANLNFTNLTREDYIKAKIYNMKIPLEYNFKIIDDYFNINFKESLESTFVQYDGDIYEDASFVENKHQISISTDLLKPYEKYLHTINLNAAINIPNNIRKKGDIYGINSTNSENNKPKELEPFLIVKTKKNLDLNLNHSIYKKGNLKQILNHKIYQSISFEDNNSFDLSTLENDLTYYGSHGRISNKLIYDHKEFAIVSMTSSVQYKKNDFFFNIDHSTKLSQKANRDDVITTYTYDQNKKSESLSFKIGNKFNRYYSFSYKENLDLLQNVSNIKEYTLKIDKKCWGLNVKLSDNLVSAPTIDSSAIRQNTIYFEFLMKPIGGIRQKYVQKR